MPKIYLLVGGGILLAAVAGITIATMQPKTTPPTTSAGSPSLATDALSPTAVTTSPTVASSPASPGLGKPTPLPSTATLPTTPSSGGSPIANPSPSGSSDTAPVAIAPQTTGSNKPIQLTLCKISTAQVSDPNPPLNVRSTPEVKPDNIVGKLNNGTFLQVKTEKNDWFQVTATDDSKISGWVSKKQTDYSCGQKVADLNLIVGASPVTIADRFIGTGTHQYKVTLRKGQPLVLTVKSGPAPYLMDPSEKLIAGDGQGGGIDGTWSGTLPADGVYTIALDSNYRGYSYNFSVQLK